MRRLVVVVGLLLAAGCGSSSSGGGGAGPGCGLDGAVLAIQVPGDCKTAVCDGRGGTRQVNDDADMGDDGNPCTDDLCNAGAPLHVPVQLSQVCGVGLVCDGAGHCVGCFVAGDCPTPANPCEEATCNLGVCGIGTRSAGSACDDGNACTQVDACLGSVCTGSSLVTCTALDQCHDAGSCNALTGTCSSPSKANGTSCDDGNPGTVNDACVGGTCVGGDLCAGVTCTALDQCHLPGTCNPATGACTNPVRTDFALCDDGNACTQLDMCVGGICTSPVSVTCTPLDECHQAGVCNPATGACSNPSKSNGTPCTGGTCQGGTCTP